MKTRALFIVLIAACAWPAAAQQASDLVLVPTNHPRLPSEPSQFWMAPNPSTRSALAARTRGAAQADLVAAVKLEIEANYAKALPLLSQPAVQQGPLGPYAEYYKGFAELRLGRAADARRTFQALAATQPAGYLAEASALREAESDEALGDEAAAVEIYDRLSRTKTTAPDDVLMRLGPSRPFRARISSFRSAIYRRSPSRNWRACRTSRRRPRGRRDTRWSWAAPSGSSAASDTRRRARRSSVCAVRRKATTAS
jgi:tetratricopeptide (TPR) repeat protein